VDYGKHKFAAFWDPIMMPYDIATDMSHYGKQSLKISSNHQANKWGASQFVYLNQTAPHPLVLSAWNRAEDVTGEMDDGLSVYMDVKMKVRKLYYN
jgi:hypothetical protein